jgi:hypothetical protein
VGTGQLVDVLSAMALGVALAASCGFRVFVPPLVLSVAALSGHVTLSSDLAWIGSWPAVLALCVATALEIAAYYVPWLDHLLDHIGAPVAVAAGIVVAASVLGQTPPLLRWAVATLAGGGSAATIHIGTALARAAVGSVTAGFGNFVVASAEAVLAVLTSVLALLLPVAALLVLVAIVVVARRVVQRRRLRTTTT